MFFKNKNILVAGGTGLIGTPLTQQLIEGGARVRVVSLDDPSRAHPDAEFIQADLTDYQNCLKACKNIDYVFNLLCVKGPPGMSQKYPLTSFEPMLLFNTLLLRAAWEERTGGYLFTSSVAVYQPAEVLHEDAVWTTLPSKNDWFPGWAKRVGELHAETYRLQHRWNVAIVRPSNVYGPHDNFDPRKALFMAYIVRQFVENENPIIIGGDGSQVRDFIHSEDAARGMLLAAEKSAGPINLCSGKEITIKEVVDMLVRDTNYKGGVVFDINKPSGDKRRVPDVSKLKALGFEPKVTLEEGIQTLVNWYRTNRHKTDIQ